VIHPAPPALAGAGRRRADPATTDEGRARG